MSWMCFQWVGCDFSICGLSESDATSLVLPLWSRLWDTKHWYLHPSVFSILIFYLQPGIHTPNCLKKWTEEQEGLAPNLRKPPPSPPPGRFNQLVWDWIRIKICCLLRECWVWAKAKRSLIPSKDVFQHWRLRWPASWVGRSSENSTGCLSIDMSR